MRTCTSSQRRKPVLTDKCDALLSVAADGAADGRQGVIRKQVEENRCTATGSSSTSSMHSSTVLRRQFHCSAGCCLFHRRPPDPSNGPPGYCCQCSYLYSYCACPLRVFLEHDDANVCKSSALSKTVSTSGSKDVARKMALWDWRSSGSLKMGRMGRYRRSSCCASEDVARLTVTVVWHMIRLELGHPTGSRGVCAGMGLRVEKATIMASSFSNTRPPDQHAAVLLQSNTDQLFCAADIGRHNVLSVQWIQTPSDSINSSNRTPCRSIEIKVICPCQPILPSLPLALHPIS